MNALSPTWQHMVLPEKSAFQATNTVVHADYIMIIELNIVQNKKVYLSFWHSQEIIHKTCTKNLGSKKKRKKKKNLGSVLKNTLV